MDPSLILQAPPPLDEAWLAHEQGSGLLFPKPVITDPAERQKTYSEACKALNALLLTERDKDLNLGLSIREFPIKSTVRCYAPSDIRAPNTVIYYHGGGLQVGDLDSEDLSCRRIAKALQSYADDALEDALHVYQMLSHTNRDGKLILMGSSSGGQLAAQVSQHAYGGRRINGVLLRGPVMCDAANLPSRFEGLHTSMQPAFHTSLLSAPALTAETRTKEKLPLEEEDLKGLPRHWVQVCTNDIYYSDGVCYAEALREQGVEVRMDVLAGWPHTFWLKAPLLEQAVEAEESMLEGMRWLLEG